MKKNIFRFLCFSTALSFLNVSGAAVPNDDDPTTFLGPTIKGSYTTPLYKDNALSLLGEAGLKNFRVGGTYGWQFFENQRLKFSAEYLRQQITYAFFSGNTNQWVDQWAIGGGYQVDIACNDYRPQFDLDIFYSYAPNKNLSTVDGFYTDGAGVQQSFSDQRNIAGSTGVGVAPGITFVPWRSGKLSLALNYDNVQYRKDFSPGEHAIGLGGTVRLNQTVYEGIGLDLGAAVRRPFNNYYAKLLFVSPYYKNWRFGIDGSYTVGKETLPNTYNAGIDIDYLFDCPPARPVVKSLKGEISTPPSSNDFVNWVSRPAVYMPQVLAIADSRTTVTTCANAAEVVALGPIPGTLIFNFPSTTLFPTAASFNGNGSTLTYSMTEQTTMTIGSNPNITIDPNTGVVTVDVGPGFHQGISNITVTASNGCSSASSVLVVEYETD